MSKYLVPVVATAACVALRLALAPWLGREAPLMLLILAVAAAAWHGGFRSGLLATGLCLLAGVYLFFDPPGWGVGSPNDQIKLIVFALVGVGVSWLSELARATRRRAEERSETLGVTLASIGDAVITTDVEGRVSSLNAVAEQLTGWRSADAAGRPLTEIFRIINQTTRQPVDNPALRALREGRIVGLANHTILIAKDDTERPIDDSGAPIRDRDGKTIGAVLVFRDITQRHRAEQQLHAAEQRSRGILESITDGFFTLDRDWRFDYVNPEAERILDRQAGELLGRSLWEEFPGAVGSEFERVYRRVASERKAESFTAFYPSHERWYEVRCYPAATGLSIYFRDVSDQRHADEALRLSEERYRTLFASMDEGFCVIEMIFDSDERPVDYRIVEMNPAFARHTGLQNAEGKTVREMGLDLEPHWFELYGSVAKTGQPVRFVNEAKALDGRWFEVSAFRFGGSDGRRVAVLFTDITDRKRAVESLRTSERQLREFADAAPAMLWVTDPTGHCTFLSRGWYEATGQTEAEALGIGWTLATHPDEQAEAERVFLAANERREEFRLEYRLQQSDGSYRWALDVGRPRFSPAGNFLGMVGVVLDIDDRKQAEQSLQNSENRLSQLIQTMPSFTGVLRGPKLAFEMANDPYYRLVGRGPEIIGKPVVEALPEIADQPFPALLERVYRTGEPFEARGMRVMLARGPDAALEEVFIDFAYLPLPATDGGVPGILIHGLDRTVQVRAEEAYRLSEERRRLALDSAELGSWNIDPVASTLTTDERFNIIFSGSTAPVSYEQAVAALHPDDRDRVVAAINSATKAGNAKPYAEEYRVIHPDGTIRWVFAKGRVNFAVHGDVPTLLSFDGTLADITERKQAEARNLENERRFRTLVEQVQDYAIFMTDPQGRPTTWNEGVLRVLGFKEEEFIGQEIVPLIFTPEDIESGVPDRELAEAAVTGRANDDRWMRKCDGERFFALGVTTGLRDDDGQLLGYMKVMRDQTSRKQMEDELRRIAADLSEADRRKTEFLATLGHELRNPLAPIRMGLELMKMIMDDPAAMEETRATMERQVQQITRLIDDLLDMSRITQGKLALRTCRVELAEVVRSAVEATRPFIDELRHELTVVLPREPVVLQADPNRLAQVLSNLLSNAAKYTAEGGRIDLRAERSGDELLITVQDNGLGVPVEMQGRIFEMFAQIDRPLEKGYTGLGIGLTLVKRLVEMHGGAVEVRSEGAGMGSEFSVRLPLSVGEPEEIRAVDASLPTTANRLRILVVDDNADAAHMLSLVVKALGNDVREAHDGLQGIEAAAEFRPHVILMDIGMPKMNGFEAARYLRRQPWGRKIVLVALTGWGQDDDRIRSREAGFDQHLVKPAEPAAIQRMLSTLDFASLHDAT